MGNLLMTVGLLLFGAGLALKFGLLSWFGRLPGDLRYEGDHFMVFVPFTSMILISVVLTLLLWIFNR